MLIFKLQNHTKTARKIGGNGKTARKRRKLQNCKPLPVGLRMGRGVQCSMFPAVFRSMFPVPGAFRAIVPCSRLFSSQYSVVPACSLDPEFLKEFCLDFLNDNDHIGHFLQNQANLSQFREKLHFYSRSVYRAFAEEFMAFLAVKSSSFHPQPNDIECSYSRSSQYLPHA